MLVRLEPWRHGDGEDRGVLYIEYDDGTLIVSAIGFESKGERAADTDFVMTIEPDDGVTRTHKKRGGNLGVIPSGLFYREKTRDDTGRPGGLVANFEVTIQTTKASETTPAARA